MYSNTHVINLVDGEIFPEQIVGVRAEDVCVHVDVHRHATAGLGGGQVAAFPGENACNEFVHNGYTVHLNFFNLYKSFS